MKPKRKDNFRFGFVVRCECPALAPPLYSSVVDMADIRLRAAIVDPSDMSRATLSSMLLGLESEGIWLEADCPRYDFFPEVVSQSNPDAAIIALDGDPPRALQLLEQLKKEHPALPIVAISNKAELLLQANRRGAQELLTYPVDMAELQEILKRLGGAGGRKDTTGNVIAILGSRGGIGCTSLAVNLGGTLALDKRNKVVLFDLDVALGDTDVALDLMPDFTLTELINAGDRLDMALLKRALTEHKPSGLFLLPHPVQLQEVSTEQHFEEHLHRVVELPHVVERVIGLLRSSHTHLLVDLSKSMSPTDMAVIRLADLILLVAQLELTSLRNVVRIMHTLGTEGGMGDKIQVVLNRIGADFMGGEISVKKAEQTIGKPVFWQIPNDSKSMLGARNAGILLYQHAPRSRAQLSIQGLGQTLGGQDDNKAAPKESGRRWFSFG